MPIDIPSGFTMENEGRMEESKENESEDKKKKGSKLSVTVNYF
tara:strand:+ start:1006 stop:1134 length:129 start_codon:yes stop_codon:yes gene_type:complete